MILGKLVAAAALLLLLPGLATAAVYDRPLDFVYALQGGKALSYTDEEYLAHFDQVRPGITAMIPFFLNVANPSQYDSMVQSLRQRNVTLVPAVGGTPSAGDLDMQKYKDIAQGYRNYSEYIRLENLQGFYDEYGSTGIQNMIDYCVSIGFKHIMMNPWPIPKGGGIVQFANPEVDVTYDQVLLDYDHTTYEPIANASNWFPSKQNLAKAVRAFRPTASIIINYESPPQQNVLTTIEKQKKNASIEAMQITIGAINGQFKSENLHWIPPLDESYDPFTLGTWDWIASQLSQTLSNSSSSSAPNATQNATQTLSQTLSPTAASTASHAASNSKGFRPVEVPTTRALLPVACAVLLRQHPMTAAALLFVAAFMATA